MKKAISVLLVFILAFAFASCSSKEYEDTPVTEVVTDENGEAVTDENGKTVTRIVETGSNSGNDASGDKTAQNNGSNNNANGADGNETNAANSNNNNVNNNQNKTTKTDNKEETKKTTTAAPKKREVTVDISLPYYNHQETDITVSYKADGDKKYTELDPVKGVKLDKKGKIESFELGKIKGDVTVVVKFSGIDITNNTIVISADDNKGTINPVTGIEIINGKDD